MNIGGKSQTSHHSTKFKSQCNFRKSPFTIQVPSLAHAWYETDCIWKFEALQLHTLLKKGNLYVKGTSDKVSCCLQKVMPL